MGHFFYDGDWWEYDEVLALRAAQPRIEAHMKANVIIGMQVGALEWVDAKLGSDRLRESGGVTTVRVGSETINEKYLKKVWEAHGDALQWKVADATHLYGPHTHDYEDVVNHGYAAFAGAFKGETLVAVVATIIYQ